MTTERDRFLTEAMGECWHEEDDAFPNRYVCIHCKRSWPFGIPINNFPAWTGFGKLWEWAKEQDWWERFTNYNFVAFYSHDSRGIDLQLIHPDRFADAVYTFLKEREAHK